MILAKPFDNFQSQKHMLNDLHPNAEKLVRRLLAAKGNIHLIAQRGYLPFVYLMKRSHLILADSGGIQSGRSAVFGQACTDHAGYHRQAGGC